MTQDKYGSQMTGLDRINAVKALRDATSMTIKDCKDSLEMFGYDHELALSFLKSRLRGGNKIPQRIGIIESFSHGEDVSVMIEVNCEKYETVDVPNFKHFVHRLALHVLMYAPTSIAEMMEQKLVGMDDLVKYQMASACFYLGDKVTIRRFALYDLGKDDHQGTVEPIKQVKLPPTPIHEF